MIKNSVTYKGGEEDTLSMLPVGPPAPSSRMGCDQATCTANRSSHSASVVTFGIHDAGQFQLSSCKEVVQSANFAITARPTARTMPELHMTCLMRMHPLQYAQQIVVLLLALRGNEEVTCTPPPLTMVVL